MITCFLVMEKPKGDPPGAYAVAVATFENEADRQLANTQRKQAGDEGVWFNITNLMEKPVTITQFPQFLFR